MTDCGGTGLEVLTFVSVWKIIRGCGGTLKFLGILIVICSSCEDLKTCPISIEQHQKKSHPDL